MQAHAISMRYVAAWQHNKGLININVYVIPAYYGESRADFYFDDDSGIYVRHSFFKNMITKESYDEKFHNYEFFNKSHNEFHNNKKHKNKNQRIFLIIWIFQILNAGQKIIKSMR